MTKKKEPKLPRCIVENPKADVQYVRNTLTGDRYAVDKDSIVLLAIDANGRFAMSRIPTNKVSVITTDKSPPGTGWILSPITDEPYALRDIEAAVVAALAVPAK